MGAQLNKCIEERIKFIIGQYKEDPEYSENDITEVTEALKRKWIAEIKQECLEECTEEEKKQMKESIDDERKRYSTKKAIEDMCSLITEGIILAFAVGLLVNQVTDLISYLKGEMACMITVIISVLLVIFIFAYVLIRLASAISKLIKK